MGSCMNHILSCVFVAFLCTVMPCASARLQTDIVAMSPDGYVLAEQQLLEGEVIPAVGTAAEPALQLVSLDEQGRALLSVANYGSSPIRLPCSGCAEAAPAYRLHLWDAEGNEHQVEAFIDGWNAPLLRETYEHLIPAGSSELVEVDFEPLPAGVLSTAQRVAARIDLARCGVKHGNLPPLHSLARPLDTPQVRERMARNGRVITCFLRLLSLDLRTGEAHCEIRNEGSLAERAYFCPGSSWGDSCFSLRVKDESGRELSWHIRRMSYFRNFPGVRHLHEGECVAEDRLCFGFVPEEGQELTEEQRAFLAALRRPGAQVRVDYHMTQACFLSAAFSSSPSVPLQMFPGDDAAPEVQELARQRERMTRTKCSDWQAVESLPAQARDSEPGLPSASSR